MKASELRIGNLAGLTGFVKTEILINCHINEPQDLNKEAFLVISFEADQILLDIGNEIIEFSWEEVNPIPLTKDWLLNKLGFKQIGSNYEFDWLLLHTNNKTGTIDFLLNEPNTGKYKATVLKYVHQLQNLYFALTGEELKYTL